MAQTLFGRAGELREIAARIGAVRQQGSAIAVCAPAGGGVSTVLAAAAQQARDTGLTVVIAQPAGLAGQLPGMLRATEPMLLVVDDLDRLGADARETID